MENEEEARNVEDYPTKKLIFRFFQQYIRPNGRRYYPIQALHVVGTLVGLVPPILLRRLIDNAIPSKDFGSIIFLSAASLLAFGVTAGMRFVRSYFGHRIAQKMVFDMRNDLYSHFQSLSMQFHDDKKTGDLMSRVIDDLNLLQEFVHHGPEGLLTATTNIVGVLTILFLFNVPLTLVALSFTPFLVLFAYFLLKRMHKSFRKIRGMKAELNSRLEDNLAGIKVLKSFANEEFEMERFASKNKEHLNARAKAIKYFSMLGPGSFFFNSIGLTFTLGYGGYLVTQGSVTAGTVVAFYTYLLRFRAPILRLVRLNQRLSRFFASMERFFSHMDIEPAIKSRSNARKKEERLEGKVEFDNVYFTYQEGEQVLTNINLDVDPEQTIAFVGPSGSGKTTLISLIPRLYDVDQGEVRVDGIDVREWGLNDLRDSISMVMQDDYLFSGPIKENIAYGRPGAPEEEVLKMAREANVENFVSELPDGFESEIGQRGVKLSGGQRQRISIARALLKDPEILILDEATSSVDTYTEKLIQQAIDRVSEGRTTFIIAHRLSTITNADEIIFIEDGRIKERGSFEKLMELEERFHEFYRLQYDPDKNVET